MGQFDPSLQLLMLLFGGELLTYMSILDEIQKRCNELPPQLVLMDVSSKNPRLRAIKDRPRSVYVSRIIQQFFDSSHDLVEEARADLEHFILGRRVVIALKRDHKDCRMARLERPSDEIWEIRVLDTNPQLRLFGRFADRNVFVVLIGPIERENLTTEKDFEQAKRDCKAEWLRLFGVSNPPLEGDDAYDYISQPFRVV